MPTRYQVKGAVRYPVIAWRRRQFRDQSIFVRQTFDNCLYSKACRDFLDRSIDEPEVLTTFDSSVGGAVVDVGTYVGGWAEKVGVKYGLDVQCFELSPSILPVLLSKTSDDDRLHVNEYGLGGTNAEIPISRSLMGSSTFDYNSDGAEWELGRIRDVYEVWLELDLQNVAAMKINIEGGEYELLERMITTGLIDKVGTFLIQFHEWLPRAHRRRRSIRRALSQTHSQEWNYPFVWEKWVLDPAKTQS